MSESSSSARRALTICSACSKWLVREPFDSISLSASGSRACKNCSLINAYPLYAWLVNMMLLLFLKKVKPIQFIIIRNGPRISSFVVKVEKVELELPGDNGIASCAPSHQGSFPERG